MAAIKQKNTVTRPNKSKEALPESKVPGAHVGQLLRQAREERGLTLDNVADELMIRRFYLEALENGSFKDLPERVYAMGFVKNYATYLAMPTAPLLDQFKREAYGARNQNNYQVELSMPQPVVQSVVPNRSAIISAIVVLAVLIAGIVFMTHEKKSVVSAIPEPTVLSEQEPAKAAAIPAPVAQTTTTSAVTSPVTTTPSTPVAASASGEMPAMEFVSTGSGTAPAVTTTTTAAPTTEATATEEGTTPPAEDEVPATTNAAKPVTDDVPPAALRVKNRRVLEALQSAWVEVRNDKGVTLFTSILKAGQILPLPDNTRITLTTGNAGGMRLIVDGKPQAVFGQVNEVKRSIMLDPQALGPKPAPAAGTLDQR